MLNWPLFAGLVLGGTVLLVYRRRRKQAQHAAGRALHDAAVESDDFSDMMDVLEDDDRVEVTDE